MKIGGLTWWRNNYGSILQAYALQQKISGISGMEYEIINQYGKKITSVDNLKNKIRSIGVRKTVKRAFWKIGLRRLRERVYNIQSFIDHNMVISSEVYDQESIQNANSKYDGFICGSDQVWNPAFVPIGDMYWISFAGKEKRKIAYAPSMGTASFDARERLKIRDNLKSFRFISCREESGTKAINEILGEDRCVTVLDPTMLMDALEWDKIASERKYREDYIFAYMLRGSREQRRLIEQFARKMKMPIVTIPILDPDCVELYDLRFGQYKCWDASPTDFISLIKNASYVFGDSFHCMVFSCIYHVPFFVFPKMRENKKTDYAQISRMTDFLSMTGIKDRILYPESSIEDIVNDGKIDWATVDSVLQRKREFSLHYLYSALKDGMCE